VPERDATELALVEAARASATPLLAICRGIQILNIALGGTLVQDLPSERPSEVAHGADDARTRRTHAIRVVEGSRLARALGAGDVMVN
jgi:putative glutamine amidotransferase